MATDNYGFEGWYNAENSRSLEEDILQEYSEKMPQTDKGDFFYAGPLREQLKDFVYAGFLTEFAVPDETLFVVTERGEKVSGGEITSVDYFEDYRPEFDFEDVTSVLGAEREAYTQAFTADQLLSKLRYREEQRNVETPEDYISLTSEVLLRRKQVLEDIEELDEMKESPVLDSYADILREGNQAIEGKLRSVLEEENTVYDLQRTVQRFEETVGKPDSF